MAPSGATAQLDLDDSQNSSTAISATAVSSVVAWQYISVPFTATSTGKLRVHLQQSGSGTVYWDDVAVFPVLPVSNASFESGTTQSWTAYNGATPSASSTTAHGGTWSLAIPAASSSAGAYQSAAVMNGGLYAISAWVFVPSGVTAQLSVNDSQGGAASTATAAGPNGVWQYISTIFTADSTGILQVQLLQSGSSGTVYWDDVSVASAGIPPGPAPYTYDYTSSPVSSDASRWQNNGGTFSGTLVNFSGSGGSLISLEAISGTNSNDSETDTTLALKGGGGTYIQFFRANSTSVQAGSGSYVSVEIATPSGFTSPGAATLKVNQCASGTVTQIGSASITATDGMTVKSVIWGTNLYVFLNNVLQGMYTVPTMSGVPGIGGYGMPSGSGITSVMLGAHYVGTPPSITQNTVGTSEFPNTISLKWEGVGEPAGVGVFQYTVYRNGTLMGNVEQADFADSTVQPSTTYTYTVFANDYHGNVAQQSPGIQVTTPPATSIDPRRVGVFTTGSYWGGGGEQIDTLSGNLNFTLPLVKPQGRNGWSVPVNLSYNSQNWRQDNGVDWQLGSDVGYGFGWQARIGSITPYYSNWASGPDHFVYTDGTGAEYRLSQNNSGIWSSTQGIFVWFDATTNVLHFPDGTFWAVACTSGGAEPDAGTMYPTTIEDVNGNQVLVTYLSGGGLPATAANTSARISTIQDVRGRYTFTWNGDYPTPHLAAINQNIGTNETFTFGYAGGVALQPPFGNDPGWGAATTAHLSQIVPGYSLTTPVVAPYQLTYDLQGAGELMEVVFPYGGHLRWTYASDPYVGNRNLRAVSGRYLAADSAGATEWSYGIARDNASGGTIHATITLTDASGVGSKTWNFITPGTASGPWQVGLISSFNQLQAASGTVLKSDIYTWSQTPTSNNPYISTKVAAMNPGGSNAQSTTTTQTEDQYGNVTQAVIYPYNSTTTPLKTYANVYLNSSTYTTNYIFNRLLTTTLTMGSTVKTLINNYYDGKIASGQPTPTCGGGIPSGTPYAPYGYQPPTNQMDPNPPVSFGNRGLVSALVTAAKTSCMAYYSYGGFAEGWASDGTTMTASADAGTNYAAPQTVTTQSYSDTIAYNSWLAITQTTGLNGEQLSMTYDPYTGRPTSGVTPYGATTRYTYSASGALPATQTKTGPDGQTVTTLDGLGRAIRVARYNGSPSIGWTLQSYTDTVYAPCACSPLGKIQKVSEPYAANATEYWTTYTYDGMGRTLAVQQPDGASTSTYSYSGNQTTLTDPAGNWKTFTTDALGNLVTVTEPDPSNQPGGTLTSTYTYDWMNHLAGVSMPRGSTTQMRTFAYSDAGLLTSATNPENGTVQYSYNSDNTLQYKHDAKGQDTVYTYDSQKRVTEIQRYPHGKNNSEDTCQQVLYSYGTSAPSANRLTGAQYNLCGVSSAAPTTFAESYSYHPAGAVTGKTLSVLRKGYDSQGDYYNFWTSVSVSYSYTTAGLVSTVTYPFWQYDTSRDAPTTFTYIYDGMGRPISLTDDGAQGNLSPTTWVQNVQYDFAGRMYTWQHMLNTNTGAYTTEAVGYNASGQMTSKTWTGNGTVIEQWIYSATQNNGQIQQMTNSASVDVTYQYDRLKRLTSATATAAPGSGASAWTETFGYDGFGNLTSKLLNGSATATLTVNGATNQLTNATYDANGNMTSGAGAGLVYDEANRVMSATETSGGTEYYGYAPDNKRIYRLKADGVTEEFTFWGAHGERLGIYSIQAWSGGYFMEPQRRTLWFAGRRIWEDAIAQSGVSAVNEDRLGSTEITYPYGEEITSRSGDRTKFATYNRDAFTGLDYAEQRYYASSYGRFNTPDPYRGSGVPNDPGSWNRYSYVAGDPVNRLDPRGWDWCPPEYETCLCQEDPTAVSGFRSINPMPSDSCGEPDPPVSGPGPTEPPPPQCSIGLYERPVFQNIGGVNTIVGEHTYIYGDEDFQDGSGTVLNFLCEGGPVGSTTGGTLQGGCASGMNTSVTKGTSGPSLPLNDQVGKTYIGDDACDLLTKLIVSVNLYQDNGNFATYNYKASGGYNSNSYAFTLLNDIGLSTWFGTPGGIVPGWGKLVPGL